MYRYHWARKRSATFAIVIRYFSILTIQILIIGAVRGVRSPIEIPFVFGFYSVFYRFRESGSHDHPSRARILTSAGPPFSNNLLVARPRNSAEKRPRGTHGVVVDTAMTIRVPRVYCCPMTRPYLHVARRYCTPTA